MDNKKFIFVIIITALVFSGLGLYFGFSLFAPTPEISKLVDWQEKLVAQEQTQEDRGLFWFASEFFGQATEIKDTIIHIEGEILDLEGKPIYREAVVTEDTKIFLWEREDFIINEEELERQQREQLREMCDYMQAVGWDSTISTWEASGSGAPEPITDKQVTITQIKQGDRVRVFSQENIAANIRFEASAIFIDRL